MKKLFRWLIVSWFVVYSALFTPLAYAASPAGWAFSSFDVATSVVAAMKNGASASAAIAKSPITSKIAKGIVGGAIVGATVPLAVSQLTGIALNAVDWVLDPANNAIKYTAPINPDSVPTKYLWASGGVNFATANLACANRLKLFKDSFSSYSNSTVTTTITGERTANCVIHKYSNSGSYAGDNTYQIGAVPNPAYNPDAPTTEEKTIPIPTVADKIFDNAKTDTASASIVNDAVKDYVNSGAADVALDAAKADSDATHNCGTGTYWSGSACVADTPSTPTTPDTPDTPFDPSGIIDAIKSVFDAVKGVFDAVMSLPDVINNALDDLLVDIKDFFQPVIDKVTDTIDWFKSDPDPQTDNTKPDIDTTPPTKSVTDFDTDYLRFGGQCPASPSTSLSVGAVSVPLSIDLTPLCDFVVLVRPAILAMAYLSALFVVARAIGETQ